MDVLVFDAAEPRIAQWSVQWRSAQAGTRRTIPMASPHDPMAAVAVFRNATTIANGGNLIIAVGHGGTVRASGVVIAQVDLAPHERFRIKTWTVEYAIDPGGGELSSQMSDQHVINEEDLLRTPAGRQDLISRFPDAAARQLYSQSILANARAARERRQIALAYQALGSVFSRLASVALLTCDVGSAPLFVAALRRDWRTIVVAYPRFIEFIDVRGRARVILHGDAEGTGSNTVRAETELPS